MNAPYQMYKGTDVILTLWAREVDATPVDLTGGTITVALPLVGGTSLVSTGTIVDAATGEFTISLADTANLTPALNIPLEVRIDYSGQLKTYRIPDGLNVLVRSY